MDVASGATVERNSTNAYIVMLNKRPNFSEVQRMPRGAERKAAAWEQLTATANESQADILKAVEELKSNGLVRRVESLVSPNAVIVEATGSREKRDVLAKLQALDGVKAIYEGNRGTDVTDATPGAMPILPDTEPAWGLDVIADSGKDVPRNPNLAPADPNTPLDQLTPAWGVDMVGAPEAWKAGATGKGLVFGSIDTGADWDHEALKHAYRGYNAETGEVSHDYNWYDPTGRSTVPSDGSGHGTHTIGSVVGRNSDTVYGVAPEAKFVSAGGLTSLGTEGMLRSLEWMQAPTKIDGTGRDATKAPDVVGMSWWNGEPNKTLYEDSMKNLVAAGIQPVKSNGNAGPGPETGSSPGQFKDIISTAAVDKEGEIADFSSRGPSALSHDGKKPLWKPDFAAPGVDVLSTVPNNRYRTMSGTSMAQPHMSGAVLSVLSKFPELSQSQLDKVLAKSAVDAGARGRDLEFGHGIVNLPAALSAAEAERAAATQPAEPATPAEPVNA